MKKLREKPNGKCFFVVETATNYNSCFYCKKITLKYLKQKKTNKRI